MAAAAHHRQVHAGASAAHDGGDDVRVDVLRRLHRLPGLHPRERAEPVAQLRRLLEPQLGRRRMHLRLDVGQHLALAALQEARRGLDILGVAARIDQPHARRAAAADLVQQAGPRPVREHRVLAGAQPEHLLQRLDRLAHRPRVRIRSEVAVAPVDGTPVVDDARELVAGELQVRVRLVVAKQDVVARRRRLDQVVLEQQRLGLGARHRGLDAHDALEHVRDARALLAAREVRGHPLLQVARLADVEHRVAGADHPVDARTVRQAREEVAQVEWLRLRGLRLGIGPVRHRFPAPLSRGTTPSAAW